MEDFKKLIIEESNDSSQEIENTSFSTLLDDIGIRANYLTSFKNIRTDSKSESLTRYIYLIHDLEVLQYPFQIICRSSSRIQYLTTEV